MQVSTEMSEVFPPIRPLLLNLNSNFPLSRYQDDRFPWSKAIWPLCQEHRLRQAPPRWSTAQCLWLHPHMKANNFKLTWEHKFGHLCSFVRCWAQRLFVLGWKGHSGQECRERHTLLSSSKSSVAHKPPASTSLCIWQWSCWPMQTQIRWVVVATVHVSADFKFTVWVTCVWFHSMR